MKTIPKKINVKQMVFLCYSLKDIAIMLIAAIAAGGAFLSGHISAGIVITITAAAMFVPAGGSLFYEVVLSFVKYLFRMKKTSAEKLKEKSGFIEINIDGEIVYRNGFARLIRISPFAFFMENESRREMVVNAFASALNFVSEASIFKVDIRDNYRIELERLCSIMKSAPAEKLKILESEMNRLDSGSVYAPCIVLVVYEKTRAELNGTLVNVMRELGRGGIENMPLGCDEATVIFKAVGEFIGESLTEKPTHFVGKKKLVAMEAKDYPLRVRDGFLAEAFSLQSSLVHLRMKTVNREKAIARIDRAISEIDLRISTSEKRSEIETLGIHKESLVSLLESMSGESQTLMECSLSFLADGRETADTIKRQLLCDGIRVRTAVSLQKPVLEDILPHPSEKVDRALCINSLTIAAAFPFVFPYLKENGPIIGRSGGRLSGLDIWKRDSFHQNSNGFIIGKSGSGKSYFLKNFLFSEWSRGSDIIVLDPEGEYGDAVAGLGGRVIDFSTGARINPFHIYPKVDGENSFSSHLKTLEEFFNITLRGSGLKTLEEFNRLALDMYTLKGIGMETDFSMMKPSDFPTFSDLDALVAERQNRGEKVGEETLMQLDKFVKGRYSAIFNGASIIEASESLVSFDFKPLFANKNEVVANAEMLLVFDMLENRLLNHSCNRTILAVDEAHLFINPLFPVSLDFFGSMAKRIRKYNGSFIAASQSITDWISTEQVRTKSTGLIKNSQYSFFFKLSPFDARDLSKLYGEDNFGAAEEKVVIGLGTGEMYLKGTETEKIIIHVEANDEIAKMIGGQ